MPRPRQLACKIMLDLLVMTTSIICSLMQRTGHAGAPVCHGILRESGKCAHSDLSEDK